MRLRRAVRYRVAAMLTEIQPALYGVTHDIRYARDDNVAGFALYSRPGCYLNATAADHLRRAVDLAARQGLGVVIYDAFRPIEAQIALRRRFPDSPYVSDPVTGSAPHCRGAAVDLALTNGDGEPLDFGTGFDDFSAASHHGATDISAAAERNRHLLLGIMTAAGWDFYRREWWHYQLFEPRRHPLLSDSVLPRPMMANLTTDT